MIEIYYIEDDRNIAAVVRDYLEQKGFGVSVYATIASAKEAFQKRVPGLVLVDWNMPDGQGDAFCRFIRSHWNDLPLIFLTVRDDSRDVISGFQNGADDYVVKPFELDVLYSRICALLRRAGNVSEQYLSCDLISLDQSRMMVFCEGEEISLSQMEYQLLLLLLKNKGKTVTRDRLLQSVWDMNGSFVNDNTLTVTMKRLREKLKSPSCLKTVRSFGYRMEESECIKEKN
ncbi:response regulator transcription factor [Diplocloster agilis]|uniref:Stage 0 sporulation protein A homolog n=1 Tax=Diplocloster agilis TaxID=2850323 RepID=A0A949JVZ9_9FIRM|nr:MULTISPECIES: response regulator transcription factor [Lachnospiraceae]MBU9735114.1 response regulator transcription factor [Diplocloster agilis]MBU9744115.1 response regulator transcription factor [Diplocloster agilis]MCU6735977.1 response regulator transcription factor [Suonthocola fibrivorans]SCJ84852.1 Sensory transduction protein regX3 [uncultured Clostridium sp.]